MKRFFTLACLLLTCFSLCMAAGCQKNTKQQEASTNDTNTSSDTDTNSSDQENTPSENDPSEDTDTPSEDNADTNTPSNDPAENTNNPSDTNSSEEEPEIFSTFTIVTEPFDGGQAVTKVILDRKEEVTAESIDTNDIIVMANHCNTRRSITDAYPSDADGNRAESGQYLTLELEHTYLNGFFNGSATIAFDSTTWMNKPLELDYSVTVGDLYFAQGNIVNVLEDEFSFECSESGLNYRLYCPEDETEARPLIIWIHGMGEGGSDNRIQIVSNKACNFAAKENQDYFGGAYVVAPQCPDFWASDFNFTARSPYVDKMVSLIEEVIAAHNIDTSRVYIGGCSMGGYMTWQTILEKPELFAAAFPTCAAYAPTKEDAQKIAEANLPVWVIYAANDKTVSPDQFTRPSVTALQDANATVKVTEFPEVKEDNISYDGHWSWIYVYNNHVVDEDGLTLMEWLASQSR